MKNLLIKIISPFLLTVFFLSIPQFVAADDICVYGSSAANMTVKEADKLFEEKLDGLPITGSGTVTSVIQQGAAGTDQNVTVNARCNSGVNLVLYVDALWVKRHNVHEGSMVRFNGKCVRLQKRGSTITCIVQVTD